MIDKSQASLVEALSQIQDGSTIMIGGFGTAGQPAELIDALIELGVKDLVIVNNNAGNGDYGLAKLLKTGAVRKIICSFPRQSDSWVFDELYHAGKIELELVPQGNNDSNNQCSGFVLVPVSGAKLLGSQSTLCCRTIELLKAQLVGSDFWIRIDDHNPTIRIDHKPY